jgi:hypothetical protein
MKESTSYIIFCLIIIITVNLFSCNSSIEYKEVKPVKSIKVSTSQYLKYVVKRTKLGSETIQLDSTIIGRTKNDTIHRTYFTTLSK